MFIISDFIHQICMPVHDWFQNNQFKHHVMEVAGWGMTNISNILISILFNCFLFTNKRIIHIVHVLNLINRLLSFLTLWGDKSRFPFDHFQVFYVTQQKVNKWICVSSLMKYNKYCHYNITNMLVLIVLIRLINQTKN